jgi:hypothetical protein
VVAILAVAIIVMIWRYDSAIGAWLTQFGDSGPWNRGDPQGLLVLGIIAVFLLLLVKILIQRPPSQR